MGEGEDREVTRQIAQGFGGRGENFAFYLE